MTLDRRRVLQLGAASAVGAGLAPLAGCSRPLPNAAADHTIEIGPANLEVAPGVTVSTTAYNGQFPGPLIRLTEGRPVSIDIRNRTGMARRFRPRSMAPPRKARRSSRRAALAG